MDEKVLKAITKPGLKYAAWAIDVSCGIEEAYMILTEADSGELCDHFRDLEKQMKETGGSTDGVSMAILKYRDGEEIFISGYEIEEFLNSVTPF